MFFHCTHVSPRSQLWMLLYWNVTVSLSFYQTVSAEGTHLSHLWSPTHFIKNRYHMFKSFHVFLQRLLLENRTKRYTKFICAVCLFLFLFCCCYCFVLLIFYKKNKDTTWNNNEETFFFSRIFNPTSPIMQKTSLELTNPNIPRDKWNVPPQPCSGNMLVASFLYLRWNLNKLKRRGPGGHKPRRWITYSRKRKKLKCPN